MKIFEIKDAKFIGPAEEASGSQLISSMFDSGSDSLCKESENQAFSAPEDNAPEGQNSFSIQKLDTRAPRYTSYPTADRFVEAFGQREFAQHLSTRDMGNNSPLSVYVHIPFCSQLCFYCACNKTITQQYEKAIPYVKRLCSELALVSEHMTGSRRLMQIHWGGGTPTFLENKEIRHLMQALSNTFDIESTGEYSIEIDPRTVDQEKLQILRDSGFNRLSLGVQDFDVSVQSAINRVQPAELVEQVLQESRDLGFQSTNFDLIYGLPNQSVETYRHTIEQVIRMRPERIALYNYAHLPKRFKAQRLINDDDMPSVEEKFEIFDMVNQMLDSAGYQYIGMDHFALPDDELSQAYRSGRLHRNFQGYSTQPDCDLVALGASSISRIGSCYSQNARGVNEYSDYIDQGEFATIRGFELNRDDILRRALIMAIMCQGQVDKDSIEIAHLVDFDSLFRHELNELEIYASQGYVELSDRAITVTPTGRRKALRLIAGVFDRYLREKDSRTRYSRVL